MDDDYRRLLARTRRAEEDAQHLRERLAAAYQEIARLRALIDRGPHHAALQDS